MRKELREIQHIEHYLSGRLSAEEARTFRIRLRTDRELQQQLARQTQTYRLIRQYARRQLRRELETIHRRLMRRPSFRQRVL
jgi:anti-sigma factor RsiW